MVTSLTLIAVILTATIFASSAWPQGLAANSSIFTSDTHVITSGGEPKGIPVNGRGAPGAPGAKQSRDTDTPDAPANQPGSLYSSNAIIVSLGGGDVLYDLSADEQIYPASLTKIMTAIIVIESGVNPNDTIVLEQDTYNQVISQNLMTAGLLPGESYSIKELLYGLILESGADCALGLAKYVSGTETEFAELMNSKAIELGMRGTHFTNSTGRHDRDHYSTVKDISALLAYSLQNDTFYKIFTSRYYETENPTPVTFNSTLFSKTSGEFENFRLLGGKTGYTYESGQCLASLWEAHGNYYILVTAGAYVEDNYSETRHIMDALALMTAL